MTRVRSAPVFSIGRYNFTWLDVIEAARVRGELANLQQRLLRLRAREESLAAVGALPDAEKVRSAAHEFRYRLRLLSADELYEWLDRCDVTYDEWLAEMQRSLIDPTEHEVAMEAEALERATWVHAVCSGRLAEYARTFAEEVAIHLREQPSLSSDDLLTLSDKRARFAQDQSEEPALAAEIAENRISWTRVDLHSLTHGDEMVVREAALCVRLDGRALADVARDANTSLDQRSVLLGDAEPELRTRLLAANDGELIGPFPIRGVHQVVFVERREPPSLDDPAVRRRAKETVINRALNVEVNRLVNWHESL